MIALLRETRTNRYTVNALTALLDAAQVPWRARLGPVARAAADAARGGRRALVFYSFMTPQVSDVGAEVAALRRVAPEAVLLAGGPHASADPEGTLALGFDHVFRGEAERTLLDFLAAGGRGAAVVEDPLGPPDLDPYPAFGGGRFGPLELTRGCSGACAFCGVGRRRVRHRGVESAWAAAEYLRSTGRTRIAFVTPDAFSYPVLEELLSGLGARGMRPDLGSFPSEVRPERVTPEAVAQVRRLCGNRRLVIGAQSGSDAVLRRLGRGHSVEDALRAALTARRAGLLPHVDVIFGLPDETPGERRSTVAFCRRIRREAGAKVHAHYFHPLPGTPLWGRLPTRLDSETRGALQELRAAGVEDGAWQEQERWAWQIVAWSEEGVIRTPTGAEGWR